MTRRCKSDANVVAHRPGVAGRQVAEIYFFFQKKKARHIDRRRNSPRIFLLFQDPSAEKMSAIIIDFPKVQLSKCLGGWSVGRATPPMDTANIHNNTLNVQPLSYFQFSALLTFRSHTHTHTLVHRHTHNTHTHEGSRAHTHRVEKDEKIGFLLALERRAKMRLWNSFGDRK